MEKIKIKKEIFDEVLNEDVLNAFHNDINSKNYSLDDNNKLIQSFLENQTAKLVNNLLSSKFYDQVINYICDFKKLIDNIKNFDYKNCQLCNKKIIHNIQDYWKICGSMESFNKFFCNCKQPRPEYNKDIYYTNLNILLFNWMSSIGYWERELYEIINLFLDLQNNKTKKVLDKTKLNYKLHSLFINEYKSIENVKFQLYLMNFNNIIDEKMLSDSFIESQRANITDVQNNIERFRKVLKKVLKLDGIKYDEKIFHEIGIISFNVTNLNDEWITKQRNNIIHNFITSTNGNYYVKNLASEQMYLKLSILFHYENIYFLYCILYIFKLLE